MKKIIIVFLFLFVSINFLSAQSGSNVSNVATTAAPFLEIGIGARAVAMGGAFVATANDASALYWNPAGVGRLSRPELIFVHTDWLADVNFDFAGAVLPMGRLGTLGASITSLNMKDMQVRTVDQPEGTGEFFHAGDLSLMLTYGFKLTERFAIGFNAKYIYQKIWEETAQGYAIDIGSLFTTGLHGMRIGAALTNFGTDLQVTGDNLLVYHDIDPYHLGNNDRIFAQLQTNKWPLPLNFQAGVAMELFQNPVHRLTTAVEAMHPINNTESVHLGFEYAFRELFFLRAGYRNLFQEDSEEGPTFGAGFSHKFLGNLQVMIDYAYADFGQLENAQRFSFSLRF